MEIINSHMNNWQILQLKEEYNMFKIRYFIYDLFKEKIKNLDLESFDREWYEIYGTFEIRINNQLKGFVADYSKEVFATKIEKEKFDSIWLMSDVLTFWIDIFLQIAINLRYGNEYVAFRDIENINWLEFIKKNEYIYISEIEGERFPKNFQESIVLKKVYIDNKGKMNESFFKNEKVNYKEFIKEIEYKSKQFIEEIKLINPVLLNNTQMKKIILKYQELKNYIENDKLLE